MKVNLKQNLEQIRAKNAFMACADSTFSGKNKGEVVKKIPTMIRENGFLGALAFAIEKKEGYERVFLAIIKHLKSLELIGDNKNACDTLQDFLKFLLVSEKETGEFVDRPSGRLRRVTAETMLYLNYLRCFAKTEDGD